MTTSTFTDNTINRETHAVTGAHSRLKKARKMEMLIAPYAKISGAKILDIGAGSGEITNYFAAQAGPQGEVVGIDAVNQLCGEFDFRFELAEGTAIPCETGVFDIVMSNHVIEHVGAHRHQARHLSEIWRVLKKDGVLYLAFPNRWGLVEPHYRLPFLSWLPKRVADFYVALSGRGEAYDCDLLSRGDVMKLSLPLFEIHDETKAALKIYIATELTGLKRIAANFASRFPYPLLRPFIPTIIFVCKPR
ncbi:class I SAM-dependent methyltransferase [Hyphococcus luteus]|nr:class I SAM-dependent methyltransferase [Marinicaulis flavus]